MQDPFAGVADIVEETGPVQVSPSGKKGRVDTTTMPAVPLDRDPFAGLADVVDQEAFPASLSPVVPWWKRAPSVPLTAADVLAPRNAQAQREGLSLPQRMAATGLDALTLIPRVAAGTGNAIGQAMSDIQGNPIDAWGNFGRAFQEGMARPGEAVAQSLQDAGVDPKSYLAGVARDQAEMAESPFTMAATAIPAGRLGSFAAGLGSYALNSAERYAQGRGGAEALGSETVPQMTADLLPMGAEIGAAALRPLGGAMVKAGPALQKLANERFTAGITPRQRTGREAEGLQQFLAAGGLPEVATWSDLNWKRPAERFFATLEGKAAPEYQQTLASADAAAAASGMPQIVPKGELAKGVEQGILGFSQQRPGAFTAQDMAAARQDVFDRLTMSGATPETQRALAFTEKPAAVPTHLTPSEAHRLKSGLAADAYKRKEMSKAVEAGEEGAANAARAYLGNLFPDVAALNAKWSPWYAARDAMETAMQRGSNRKFLTNLRNFPESPGATRIMYGLGSMLPTSLPSTEAAIPLSALFQGVGR